MILSEISFCHKKGEYQSLFFQLFFKGRGAAYTLKD